MASYPMYPPHKKQLRRDKQIEWFIGTVIRLIGMVGIWYGLGMAGVHVRFDAVVLIVLSYRLVK